jgi:hypothetical protein
VKIEPATIEGMISGQTTLRKVRHDLAPKSADASNIELGSLSRPLKTGKIMYGNHKYVNVMMVAAQP